MPRKVFQLKVELDIQAISCPGVWLCPSGSVSLQLYMLDSCIQTSALEPIFPLLYHEKFVFYKIFYNAHRLSELQKLLNKESIYAELIQWQNCDVGNVLATFDSSLSDLLYPSAYEGAIVGVDIDLLMEPSKSFPGIIAPKIEVSTRTTIEETLCRGEYKGCTAYVINPKVITSTCCDVPVRPIKAHQRKVCHSVGYHRAKKTHPSGKRYKRPPFVFRKVNEDLINRKPQGLGDGKTCKCRLRSKSVSSFLTSDYHCQLHSDRKLYSKLTDEFLKSYPKAAKMGNVVRQSRSRSPKKGKKCLCGSGHADGNCPVCAKYQHYFYTVPPCASSKRKTLSPIRTKLYDSCPCHSAPISPDQIICSCGNSPFRKRGVQKAIQYNKVQTKSLGVEVDEDINRNVTFKSGKKISSSPGSSPRQNDTEDSSCLPKTKTSLATQLHNRLTQTLKESTNCIPCVDIGSYKSQLYDMQESIYDTEPSSPTCQCPKIDYGNDRREFYDNLEKFYERLYKRAHSKARSAARQHCTCIQ